MSGSRDDPSSTTDPGGREPDPARRRERRTGLLAGVGLLVLLVGLYVAAVAVAGDRIPTATRVAGVKISGLTPSEATDTLTEELVPRTKEPIQVLAAGETARFQPKKLGLRLDVEATVARAGGGTKLDPRELWTAFFGGDRVQPVVRVKQARLIKALRKLSSSAGQAGVQPAITFRGVQPVLRQPRAGVEIDVGKAAVAVLDSWLVSDGVIELPVRDTPIKVRRPERKAAMELAERAVDKPITLAIADRRVRVAPKRFAPALSYRAAGSKLRPRVDAKLLSRRLRDVVSAATGKPRDATFTFEGGRPRIQPGHAGTQVEPRRLAAAVLSATRSKKSRVARVRVDRVRPDVKTADLRKLGIKRRIGSFTTSYPHADYRNTNIGRAAQIINGTVLRPGETFSLNGTVGERTAANGFVEGSIISDGILVEDFGGGVSQVATTLFNAMFFAGLKDVEHKPHSFYIDRYPVGREATVAWGSVDLRFKNNTPHGVYIRTYISPSSPGGTGQMHAAFWGTKTWDIEARASERYDPVPPETRRIDDPECEPFQGYGGFEVDVYRDFRRPGKSKVVRTEKFHTAYTPADTVICI
ncbi:VanW family protein [soil metagenome]